MNRTIEFMDRSYPPWRSSTTIIDIKTAKKWKIALVKRENCRKEKSRLQADTSTASSKKAKAFSNVRAGLMLSVSVMKMSGTIVSRM
jgi:hypothetical protein